MNNWTAEKIFNRETFEAWLASQPADRVFNYMDNHGCVVCHFIKETTNAAINGVGGDYVQLTENPGETLKLPQWAYDLLANSKGVGDGIKFIPITITSLRTAYQKLFGVDVCAEYPTESTAVETVAGKV